MMPVDVLLSGMLRMQNYGQGLTRRDDGTYRVWMRQESTVVDVIKRLGVPARRVVMTMVNGRQCQPTDTLKRGDRVVLIPEDVAALWRALGRQNLGMGIGYDS